MVSLKKVTTIAAVATLASAADGTAWYHTDDLSLKACEALFKKITFFDKKDKKKFCNVDNQPALGSMAHCLANSPHKKATQLFLESCSKTGLTEKQFWDSYDNATNYLVAKPKEVKGFNKKEPFWLPVGYKKEKYIASYYSNLHRFLNFNRSQIYSWILLGYWGLVCLIAGFCKFLQFAFPKFAHSFNGRISNTYRKHITLPGLFNGKVAQHGKFLRVLECVVPTRLETILIFIWFVLVVAFCTSDFQHDKGNTIWKVQSAEMGRKIADRTGVIASYMMPQLILFAGRNNFLEWVSGWSFSRFNLIHHWYARILFLLTVIHGVGMTYNGIGGGKLEKRNAELYVQLGIVATICMGLMCVHSLAVIRKRSYDLFVLTHNILAIVVVAGTWVHLKENKYEYFMYAATAVWAFDKFIRIVRCAWFGIQTADIQLVDGDCIKVVIPRPKYWKSFPMSYSFVYFFRPTCFWQAHPFTVIDSAIEENVITFYVKVKGGMTHSLYQFLSAQPEQKASVKCTVEGPYGSKTPLQHYPNVVFLGGGNGIPGLYSGALDLSKNTCQHLRMYWLIRKMLSIEWFYEELKRLESTHIQPIIYITNPDAQLDDAFISRVLGEDSSSEEKKSLSDSPLSYAQKLMDNLSFVEFRQGRPNLEELIEQEISDAPGSLAFVACGHDSFVDHLRKLVVKNLPEGKRVDFFDQMQTW